MADLAERYLREHVAVHCEPLTLRSYRHVIRKNVLPALGPLPMTELALRHAADLHYRLRRTGTGRGQSLPGRGIRYPEGLPPVERDSGR